VLKIRIRWPTGSRPSGTTTPTARRPAGAWCGAIGPEALPIARRCQYSWATLVPDPLFVLVQALGRQHRVIAPAYPPAGSMADLVAGVAAVLDAEQIATAHVVGSSFGGYVAKCLVRAHPERVDSLVLAQTGVDSLVLAQTGVRHFIGPVPLALLHAGLRVAPAGWCARLPGGPGRHSLPISARISSSGWPCCVTSSVTN
jgi:pimeloyl-ACP methyl ester carboxylesterase